MATFAKLGIPFPLLEAPTREASDYAGIATCRLCGGRDRHCFELGIGDAMILPCPICGVENGLSAHDRRDVDCRSCGSTVPFPESLKAKKQLLVCYECLRAGKAAMTKDTEFGMVSWAQAFEGVTHGVPGLRTDRFEIIPINPTRTGTAFVSRTSTSGNCSARPASTPGRANAGCSAADSRWHTWAAGATPWNRSNQATQALLLQPLRPRRRGKALGLRAIRVGEPEPVRLPLPQVRPMSGHLGFGLSRWAGSRMAVYHSCQFRAT